MIKELTIHNLAIAKHLSIDFHPGLNIITGETGAGKSILVDALILLRGGRVEPDLIRAGEDTASICGVFLIAPDSPIRNILAELSIPLDASDELVIRRTLVRSGRHRSFINDLPVTTRLLRTVGEEVIDISSQFESQRLLESQSHINYLDCHVGHNTVVSQFRQMFKELNETRIEIANTETLSHKRKREEALYEYELKLISELNPRPDDFTQIQDIVSRSQRSQTVIKLCSDLIAMLSEDDTSCTTLLQQARRVLDRLAQQVNITAGAPLQQNLTEAQAQIEDLVFNLQKLLGQFEIDDGELSQALEKLENYNAVLARLGPTIEDVLQHADRCKDFLSQNSAIDDRLAELVRFFTNNLTKCTQIAETISQGRKNNLTTLSSSIERELADLGMPKAQFQCTLVSPENSGSSIQLPESLQTTLTIDHLQMLPRLTSSGLESAAFIFSANPGQPKLALEKIASGGELSRVMLAIKTVLFAEDAMSVFVFDEIDTGISGRIADKVGRKLARFSKNRQAICITHLPQIACYANHHYTVQKQSHNQITTVEIKALDRKQQIGALAAMLSGASVTDQSFAQAEALLSQATCQ